MTTATPSARAGDAFINVEVGSASHSAHFDAEFHHHHSHAIGSRHPGNHHLLSIEGLTIAFDMYASDEPFFRASRRRVEVLHGLNLSVHRGEVIAVVGASGSGKTVLADAILGLYEPNSTVSGRIWFDGRPCDAVDLASLRGRGISLVPQSISHLEPLMTVGEQVCGAARGRTAVERTRDSERRRSRMRELFARYGFDESIERLYPHELSGGMARRILLMCALMDEPELIVADEPTPGLDTDLAVRALDDLRDFARSGGAVLLITHDLELALHVADRIAVFREGEVVEETDVASFESPDTLRHPFSRALWHAMPEHDFWNARKEGEGERC